MVLTWDVEIIQFDHMKCIHINYLLKIFTLSVQINLAPFVQISLQDYVYTVCYAAYGSLVTQLYYTVYFVNDVFLTQNKLNFHIIQGF